ncbi:hypothetical protein EMCRGX_G016255 [Ephydatia muelleri]
MVHFREQVVSNFDQELTGISPFGGAVLEAAYAHSLTPQEKRQTLSLFAMPRRFLATRLPPQSYERMREAISRELDRPRFDELVESQDYKLQVIKRSVVTSNNGPTKLTAGQAVLLSMIVDAPQPAVMISTHYNDTEQSVIRDGADTTSISDVDFSKAEDFFQLETPIDARKDHNMMKLALSIPRRTFMSRILHRYPLNRKRLAFIQRRSVSVKIAEAGRSRDVVLNRRKAEREQGDRHLLHGVRDEVQPTPPVPEAHPHPPRPGQQEVPLPDVHMHKCLLCGEEFDRASHLDRHRRKHHPPVGQPASQTPPLTPQAKSPPGHGYLSPSPLVATPNETGGVSGSNLHLLASVATPEEDVMLEPVPENFIQTQIVVMENMDDNGYQDDVGLQDQEPEPEPDRPFICDICGRKFIRATHLRRHVRIHTGEKPFACHICGRRYARGDYLRAHIQAHRRDKIHKCKHCGDMFQDLTRFADHCRIVHRDVNDEYGNPCPPPPDTPPSHQMCVAEDPLELEGAEISLVASSSPLSLPITTYLSTGEQGVELIANMYSSSSSSSSPYPHHHGLNMPLLMSHEFQLQGLEAQSDLHNGHPVPETGSEVVVVASHLKASQYIDHYIVNNSGLSP